MAGVEELHEQVVAGGGRKATSWPPGDAVDLGRPRKLAVPIAFNVIPLDYVHRRGR